MDDNTGTKIRINLTAGGGQGPQALAAIILIAVGVLLFLDNLNIFPFANFRAYWPMAIAVYGAVLLSRARNASCTVWYWTMIAVGILLTLGNLGILNITFGSLWPIFLIAAGANMLVRRSCPPSGPQSRNFNFASQSGNPSSASQFDDNTLHESVVFSSVKRRITTATFEGAELNSVFGEIKIDLRGANIATPDRRATIEANAAFGAIKLRIPETWRVVVHGTAVFGAYEDKTVPPRPIAGIDPPTLVIKGGASFGAVEIEN